MSSSLINSVPVLDGTNFTLWYQQMTSFLKSQGLYRTLIKACPVQKTEEGAPDISELIEKWEDANSKALGLIMLKLHFQIAYKH